MADVRPEPAVSMHDPRSSNSKRIDSIEVLRGLAALSVVLFHLTRPLAEGPVFNFGTYGYLGVEVFFVISGFVIPLSIASLSPRFLMSDLPIYLTRRLVRLEPAYLISILMVIVLWHASAVAPAFRGDPPNYSSAQVAAHFLYVVPLTDEFWLQPVYWTLAFEFLFYIVCGFLYTSVVAGPQAVFLLVTAAISACSQWFVSPYFLLFPMGIAVFRWYALSAPLHVTIIVSMVTGLAMVAAGAPLQAMVGFLTAAVILATSRRDLSGFILTPVLLWLGTISYSLYLVHIPIGSRTVNLLKRLGSGFIADLIVVLIGILISITVAAVFFHLVERPAIRASRSLLKRI